MKGKRILISGFLFLIILFSLISATEYKSKEITITGKNINHINDTVNETKTNSYITGNIVFSTKPNELQEIYSKSLPSVVKINIYYEYDVFVPKLKSIDFRSSFDENYPLYKDLNVKMDENINGFDNFFGDEFWREFYPGEYYSVDELGNSYTFEFNSADIIKMKKEFYDFHNGSIPTYIGTGFIINSEGYILTNAHLATLVDSEMEDMGIFLINVNYLDYYYALYYNSLYNEEISQQDYEEYFKKTLYLEENLKMENLTVSKIEVILGEGSDAKKYEGQLIDYNENYLEETGGRDWALLKIDGENFPSLLLGNSDSLPIGEDIVVIGYPWTSEGYTEIEDIYVSPTPTYGKISNIVPSGNYKDIQIDISIEGGNSGGPGLNSNGEVVGIATSGYDSLGGTYNYLTPINDVKKEISVNLGQSEVDELWNQGLENFWNENYIEARSNFEEIKSINPNHPYVQDILKQLDILPNTNKEVIETNKETEDKKSNVSEKDNISAINIIFIVMGIAIVILLLFISINLFKKNKKKGKVRN